MNKRTDETNFATRYVESTISNASLMLTNDIIYITNSTEHGQSSS